MGEDDHDICGRAENLGDWHERAPKGVAEDNAERMNVPRPRLCGSAQMMQRSWHVSVQTMTNTTMRTHPTAFCAESSA
jgi:hypothetical protein